jgi:hypothetical protein
MRDEGFQVWISFFGQHDLQGQVFVATLIPPRGRPALQPQSSPGWIFGIVTVTGPSGVGTAILPPSTASVRVMGRSRRISSPSRLKNPCGRTVISIRASPAPPPPVLASPFPLSVLLRRTSYHTQQVVRIGASCPGQHLRRHRARFVTRRVVPPNLSLINPVAKEAARRERYTSKVVLMPCAEMLSVRHDAMTGARAHWQVSSNFRSV